MFKTVETLTKLGTQNASTIKHDALSYFTRAQQKQLEVMLISG